MQLCITGEYMVPLDKSKSYSDAAAEASTNANNAANSAGVTPGSTSASEDATTTCTAEQESTATSMDTEKVVEEKPAEQKGNKFSVNCVLWACSRVSHNTLFWNSLIDCLFRKQLCCNFGQCFRW